jgi:hypothetical protein
MKNNQGLTPALFLIVLGVLILLASAGSYYLLKQAGKAPALPSFLGQPTGSPSPGATLVPVSSSGDADTIGTELESTNVGSPDEDFESLDAGASSL